MLVTEITYEWYREVMIRIAMPLECEGVIYHVRLGDSTYMDTKPTRTMAIAFAKKYINEHLAKHGKPILRLTDGSNQSSNDGAVNG